MQMCNAADGCKFAFPEDDGCYEFFYLGPDTYAFDAVPLFEDAGHIWSAPLSIVTLEAAGKPWSYTDTTIIYGFTDTAPLTDGTFEAGGGLSISVDMSSYEASALEDAPGAVVAMWYLGPALAKAGGWSFSVVGLGLSEGTQLTAYNADYDGFDWQNPGTATVDGDGVLHSDSGTGIRHLSTLILVE